MAESEGTTDVRTATIDSVETGTTSTLPSNPVSTAGDVGNDLGSTGFESTAELAESVYNQQSQISELESSVDDFRSFFLSHQEKIYSLEKDLSRVMDDRSEPTETRHDQLKQELDQIDQRVEAMSKRQEDLADIALHNFIRPIALFGGILLLGVGVWIAVFWSPWGAIPTGLLSLLAFTVVWIVNEG